MAKTGIFLSSNHCYYGENTNTFSLFFCVAWLHPPCHPRPPPQKKKLLELSLTARGFNQQVIFCKLCKPPLIRVHDMITPHLSNHAF